MQFRAWRGRHTLMSTLARGWDSPSTKITCSSYDLRSLLTLTHKSLFQCALNRAMHCSINRENNFQHKELPFPKQPDSPCISQQWIKRGTNMAELNICTEAEQKLANAVYEILNHLLPLPANVDGTEQRRVSDHYSYIIINYYYLHCAQHLTVSAREQRFHLSSPAMGVFISLRTYLG